MERTAPRSVAHPAAPRARSAMYLCCASVTAFRFSDPDFGSVHVASIGSFDHSIAECALEVGAWLLWLVLMYGVRDAGSGRTMDVGCWACASGAADAGGRQGVSLAAHLCISLADCTFGCILPTLTACC